ncbi:hypothetical protein ABW19_dt0206637 [Dactylella cylindrospora]|nr:hypothetical protein ABW19_dt0206637 [Dactylella cylindrospora]
MASTATAIPTQRRSISNQSVPTANGNTNLLITLDAFGTLYEPRAPVPEQYARIAGEFGIGGLSAEDVAGSFRSAFKALRAEYPNYGREAGRDAEWWWKEIIINTFTPLLSPTQSLPPDLPSALIHHFSSSSGYNIFPDVVPFLETVASGNIAGYKTATVGIISNSDDRVGSILQSFGVDITGGKGGKGESKAKVDFITLSYDTGFEKPARGIFDVAREAARGLRVGDDEDAKWKWYHIGDDVREDVVGAAKAGGEGILIDRKGWGRGRRLISFDGVGWDDEILVVGNLMEVLDEIHK